MGIRSVVSWAGVLAPVAAAATASAQVSTLTPTASVVVSIDASEAKELLIPGQLLPDGRYKFVYEYNDSSGVIISVSHTVDSLNNPTAMITGQIKYTNSSSTTHTISSHSVFDTCPAIPGGTLFGGAVTMLVMTNANGGGVTCADAPSAWQATINETAYHNLFSCPFQMTKTGSGSLQTSTQFGTPIPSKPGPDLADAIGMNHAFTLTDGDSLTVTTTLVVKSLGLPSGCLTDLNFDGLVDGNDLAKVLSDWNISGWCIEGDVDHNGVVDGSDLGTVLATWGDCN